MYGYGVVLFNRTLFGLKVCFSSMSPMVEDVRMSNPFCESVFLVTGQGAKLMEQLNGLTPSQAQRLLEGGYFSSLREAARRNALLPPNEFGCFLAGPCRLVSVLILSGRPSPSAPSAVTSSFLRLESVA